MLTHHTACPTPEASRGRGADFGVAINDGLGKTEVMQALCSQRGEAEVEAATHFLPPLGRPRTRRPGAQRQVGSRYKFWVRTCSWTWTRR